MSAIPGKMSIFRRLVILLKKDSGVAPPPSVVYRITEDGKLRITEDGAYRILE